jgi:NAD(P)-dependent dehydrogenase (short-subunit alcohol dehydrogenase family)
VPNDKLLVSQLDVSSLTSIENLAPLNPPVDVLVNNAGHIAEEYLETAEGIESTVATHVVRARYIMFISY